MSNNSLRLLRMLAGRMEGSGASVDDGTEIRWLLNEGFSPDEIEEACVWLKNLTLNGDLCIAIKEENDRYQANRILNNVESLKINEDAYGFLVRLKEMGLIDVELQEAIIEMAMLASDDEIGIDDIKGITAMLIFDHSPSQWKSDMMDILNDKWEKIYH